jgi:hypothetical protein
MSLSVEENNDLPSFTKRQKLNIKKEIEKLEYNEHCELFKIIMEGTDKVTINNGGVFLNMKNLNDLTLSKIQKFLEFTKENKKLLNAPRNLPIPIISHYINNDNNNINNINFGNNNNNNNNNINNINFGNVNSDMITKNIDMDINEMEKKIVQDNKLSNNQYLDFTYSGLTNDNNINQNMDLGNQNIDTDDVSIKEKLQKNIIKSKNDNFKFQSYIEKLQSSNNKSFPTDQLKKMEVSLKQNKIKLSGWNARIMKRCRDYNIDRLQTIETSGNIDDKNDNQVKKTEVKNKKPTNINMKSILKKVKNDEEIINELLDDEDEDEDDNENDNDDIDDEIDIEEEVILL